MNNTTFVWTKSETWVGSVLLMISSVCVALSTCAQTMTPVPTSSQNYVITYTPQASGIMNTAQLSGKTINELMVDVSYFDGLGRQLQKVNVKGSPLGNDIVQPFEYDVNGRESTKYLPYVAGSGGGSYDNNALTNGAGVYSFYNPTGTGISGQQQANGVVVNPKPFAKTVFEPSPLSRVLEQGAPGEAWQPAAARTTTGRSVVIEYTGNNNILWTENNEACRQVVKYKAEPSPYFVQTLSIETGGTYADNELTVTVTKDENWSSAFGRSGQTEEYRDKNGRVVLKREYYVPSGGWVLERVSTYYVYDNFGNLAFVLPPKSNPDNGLTSAIDQAALDNLCYQYQYDQYNRLVNKHLPGKDWEEMIYNALDQVVFTQDGNQRARHERTFYKYDVMGRVIISGVERNHFSPWSTIQAIVNTQTGQLWETRYSGAGNFEKYTNVCMPGNAGDMTALVVNYYDDYTNTGFPTTYAAPSSGAATSTTGMLTASKVRVLNTDGVTYGSWLWRVSYYDPKGREILTYAQHYLGGAAATNKRDVVTTTYDDFTGLVKSVNRSHFTTSATNTTAKVLVEYEYDHMGRKIKTWETIANGNNALSASNKKLLSKLEYNEIGQLMTKRLHSANSPDYTTFLQDISYRYNERGWLSQINDPSAAYSATKMFSLKLNYNTASYGTPVQYTGNIAEQVYSSKLSGLQYAQYYYGDMKRLTYGVSSAGFSENDIRYDKGGNILSLTRGNQTYGTLTYSYSNNQLTGVSAAGTGFATRTYEYDANGNAKSDGLGNAITYNMFNLPTSIQSKSLTYVYDAAGRKLRKLSGTTVTEYISGIQYNGTAIDFIQTDEGRAIKSGSTFKYEYTLTDHLGNNRATLFETGAAQVGENEYYPFGLSYSRQVNAGNKYLYNGKEIQNDLNDQYDYGARFYDPVIGRWTSVDPLAEQYRRWSPYTYGVDNPLRYIDPDGMGVNDWVNRAGKIVWDDKITSAKDKDLQKGDVYLGKNVLVGYENRDAALNEPINSARFEFYSETNHNGPVATTYGNTVPADVTKYGTLRDGLYPAAIGSRSKHPGEKAIMINNRGELPTVNGNPNDPKGEPDPAKQTLTGVFFHPGNSSRASLSTLAGDPISAGCQTCASGDPSAFKNFMEKVPDNFSGSYYLRPMNTGVPAKAPSAPRRVQNNSSGTLIEKILNFVGGIGGSYY